ncbi:hypothetical protein LSH36_16g11035 [Paralvinella palmiformis]|uniref:Glucosidase 2 subunit beta n=1 Tax=Paralvinella palmiformis TaxID=53620 RepID=A0AAD9KBC4_9ANNE|nr:hypothetical protein LSH36_16g11035 [Paralvinella palmiformis]
MLAHAVFVLLGRKMNWLYLSSFCLYFAVIGGEVKRPRGVAISKASLYDPSHDFPCFDGSSVIPFDHVNDDYCDCADGSDEPGTSACPNGSFHCTNAGYIPKYIPSSRVNDGICDCCDGTDEYSGKVTCANYCLELGRQHREEQEKKRALLIEGHQLYKEYCINGQEARQKKMERLEEIQKEKEDLEDRRNALEAAKVEAEIPESEAKQRHLDTWKAEKSRRKEEADMVKMAAAFEDLDSDKNEIITYQELQTHLEFDIDSNGEVSDEEAKEYLEEGSEVDFSTFSAKVWPHIKDIYKQPVTKTESQPDESNGQKSHEEEHGDEDGDGTGDENGEEIDDDEEETPNPEEYDVDEGDQEDDNDDEEGDDESHTPWKERFIDAKQARGDNEDRNHNEDDDDTKDMPEYNEETKALIEVADKARAAFNEVNDVYKELEKEINAINAFLSLDLGENNEFYSLKDSCYEYVDREYTYKLCPYNKCTQRDKRGGVETSLGNWGKWSEEKNKYDAMIFEKGQSCWNGPDRSVKVLLQCGLSNELIGASEPNKCEYEFKFQTPAVCRTLPLEIQPELHDEL